MSCIFTEITYPSANGTDTVHAYIYEPADGKVRGVVQLSHGMIDYVGRYTALAEALTSMGFVFAGNDHIGHGKSAASPEDFGYFGEKDGTLIILKDLHALNRKLREMYAGVPVVILGHSMGSFLSRLYVERYPHTVIGHIIHGTSGPNPILPIGKALVSLICKTRGCRYRSKLIASMAFSGYNSKFPKSEGRNAWLSSCAENISDRDTDEYTSFIFTASGYKELFYMLGKANSKKWFAEYPKNMKTLIMSGYMDPVGNYGKGPTYVYKKLLVEGCTDVTVKLYEGARHELFNECCRDTVFADIISWLGGVVEQ